MIRKDLSDKRPGICRYRISIRVVPVAVLAIIKGKKDLPKQVRPVLSRERNDAMNVVYDSVAECKCQFRIVEAKR